MKMGDDLDEHTEKTAEFYREQWVKLLMADIKNIKDNQKTMAADIAAIRSRMAWVFGLAAGMTLVFNVVWQYFLSTLKSR